MITIKYLLPAILIFLSACSPSTPPLPTATIHPTFTEEPAPTEAPIVVVGYGGPMNEVQRQCLEESERGSEMIAAFNNYIMIWQKFKVFGPGASLSYVPVLDRAFPDDPEKCAIMIEIYGDQTFAGKLVGMPFDQVDRYLATGDPDQLTPPQNATKLETNTDPAVLSKTVTEGSVYAAAGIPIGARLEFWNGEFVYVTGSVDDPQIVGKLNDKYQPEAVNANALTYKNAEGQEVTVELAKYKYTNKKGEVVEVVQPPDQMACLKLLADRSQWHPGISDQVALNEGMRTDEVFRELWKQYDYIPSSGKPFWISAYPYVGGYPFMTVFVTGWQEGTLAAGKGEDGAYFFVYCQVEAEEFKRLAQHDPEAVEYQYLRELAAQHE